MKEPKRKIAGAKQFVNAETGEVLNLQEIIEYYGDNEPWQRVRVAPLMALLDRGISHSKMKVIHWETGEVLNLQEIIEYYGDNEPWQRVRVAPLMALLDRGISHSKMKVIHWVVEHLDRENNLIYTQRHIAEQTQVAKSFPISNALI